ncbi:Omp28-related outer membrane protein [Pontibacter sp. G13]|uniref:Omp28-related outer membrane protein n=1 Tax=Pontibacter sp. G13 TaxID=3074898 RepID=UPI0028898C03|nr:Omp28-related outer membrane protein [Pontibacter sp. G13]WNJ20098.1 Omp28-related outer membrane protein [Pontibacter sp. G13]
MKHLLTLLMGVLITSTALQAQTKRVLLEEGTGTWCGFCPRGIEVVKNLLKDYPDQVIAIEVHEGDPFDSYIPSYTAGANFSSFPSAHIDRVNLGVSTGSWTSNVVSRLSASTPADISVAVSYNAGTRKATFTVTTDFAQSVSGDYRVGMIVLEDAIRPTGSGYDQANYYAGGSLGPMYGWENKPNPVPAEDMIYSHVARALLTPFGGEANSLPPTISANSQQTNTFEYTLPAEFDSDFVYGVAYLANAATGEILNANLSPYMHGSTNAAPIFLTQPDVNAAINGPYNYKVETYDANLDDVTYSASGLPAWLTLTTNLDGTATLSGMPTMEGTYTITIDANDGTTTESQTFTLNAIRDWYPIGTPAISPSTANAIDLEEDQMGNKYLSYVDNTNKVKVMKFENGTWVDQGGNLNGNALHTTMAVSPAGLVYISTLTTGGLEVHALNNGNYNKIGGTIGNGGNPEMAFAPDGTLYIVYVDWSSNYSGMCKSYNGISWNTVGNGSFSNGTRTSLPQVEIAPDGTPYIMHAFGASALDLRSQVLQYNGVVWMPVGGMEVADNVSTLSDHDIAIGDNGSIYTAMLNTTMRELNVYQLMSGLWVQIGANVADSIANTVTLDAHPGGWPVVGYQDSKSGNGTSVKLYNGTSWEFVGLQGFTDAAIGQRLLIDSQGDYYMAFIDQANGNVAGVEGFGDPTTTAIDEEILEAAQLGVYPNPNQGVFTVTYTEGTRLQVFNLSGQLVHSAALEAGFGEQAIEVNLSALQTGMYLVQVVGGPVVQTAKVLVE